MRYLIGILLFGIISQLNGQTSSDQDQFIKGQQQKRLDEIRRIEERRRAYERDPQRFMDSLRLATSKVNSEEAQNRIQRYSRNLRLDTVKVIDLSYADLEEIPEFVFEASQLRKLIVDNNRIWKLPRKIKHLAHLEDIRWNQNEFEKRPKVPKIVSLKKLEINNSSLTRVRSFRRLGNLESLELVGNQLKSVPISSLKRNRKLSQLVLTENPIAISYANFEKLSSLRVLKINKCNISEIDASLYKIPNLNELQLQENQLASLPDGISGMTELSKLSLYKNKLESLPDDFFDIPNLTVVDLYYNQIERLPKNIGKADDLRILYLAHNKIYDIPETLGNLSELNELYLHHNRISVLPASISNFKDLEVLRINDNYLMEFPRQIFDMKKIRELDIDNNDIRVIPTNVNQLQQLKLFTFDGNGVNFDSNENRGLAETIYQLGQEGVICKPSVSMEIVEDLDQ